MSFVRILEKFPLVIIFVTGVQLHFIAVIFPETREIYIHTIGISTAVISAVLILILFFIKNRHKEKISNTESIT